MTTGSVSEGETASNRQQFTVGKLDAGLAVLISQDHHVVEIPATLLPDGISSGSIVDMAIVRNESEEQKERQKFLSVQKSILTLFGKPPVPPTIREEQVTQTQIVLSWDPFQLYESDFMGIDVYKNHTKMSSLHHQLSKDSTTLKLSGLDVGTEYELHLVVRTSAGNLVSNSVTVTTLKLEDLHGFVFCFGEISDEKERQLITDTVKKWKATVADTISIRTTHFVTKIGRGVQWEEAKKLNIPIVNPDFIKKCDAEHKVQPVGPYYVPGEGQ